MERIECISDYYFESENEIKDSIIQATKDYMYTDQEWIDGLLELNKAFTGLSSIHTHILLLGYMGTVGISSSVAGKSIRNAIIETSNKV